jgi:hypothetical protein
VQIWGSTYPRAAGWCWFHTMGFCSTSINDPSTPHDFLRRLPEAMINWAKKKTVLPFLLLFLGKPHHPKMCRAMTQNCPSLSDRLEHINNAYVYRHSIDIYSMYR